MFCEYCMFYLYEKSQNERKRVRERDRVIQRQSDSAVLERENLRERQGVRGTECEMGEIKDRVRWGKSEREKNIQIERDRVIQRQSDSAVLERENVRERV